MCPGSINPPPDKLSLVRGHWRYKKEVCNKWWGKGREGAERGGRVLWYLLLGCEATQKEHFCWRKVVRIQLINYCKALLHILIRKGMNMPKYSALYNYIHHINSPASLETTARLLLELECWIADWKIVTVNYILICFSLVLFL